VSYAGSWNISEAVAVEIREHNPATIHPVPEKLGPIVRVLVNGETALISHVRVDHAMMIAAALQGIADWQTKALRSLVEAKRGPSMELERAQGDKAEIFAVVCELAEVLERPGEGFAEAVKAISVVGGVRAVAKRAALLRSFLPEPDDLRNQADLECDVASEGICPGCAGRELWPRGALASEPCRECDHRESCAVEWGCPRCLGCEGGDHGR
jgi:hypothetical protein